MINSDQRGKYRQVGETLLLDVPPKNEPHELGHTVAMIVRGSEGVLRHGPSWRKDDEICNGCPLNIINSSAIKKAIFTFPITLQLTGLEEGQVRTVNMDGSQ